MVIITRACLALTGANPSQQAAQILILQHICAPNTAKCLRILGNTRSKPGRVRVVSLRLRIQINFCHFKQSGAKPCGTLFLHLH